MMSLSVIVPIFNESKTILDVIEAVKNCHIENAYLKEIIVIDDASTDGTIAILQNYTDPVVRYIYKDKNQGKGIFFANWFYASARRYYYYSRW